MPTCASARDQVRGRRKGLEAGDLVVIGGRPGMGKTAFALGIAMDLAAHGKAGLGFSMEMPKAQWVRPARS